MSSFAGPDVPANRLLFFRAMAQIKEAKKEAIAMRPAAAAVRSARSCEAKLCIDRFARGCDWLLKSMEKYHDEKMHETYKRCMDTLLGNWQRHGVPIVMAAVNQTAEDADEKSDFESYEYEPDDVSSIGEAHTDNESDIGEKDVDDGGAVYGQENNAVVGGEGLADGAKDFAGAVTVVDAKEDVAVRAEDVADGANVADDGVKDISEDGQKFKRRKCA